ncbi:hypothetical protein Hamer_G015387 [Homarus americanus]|uniref:Uncharacterized protein n=1 Tax=Homarus americanus TaxID=6706 RepID=A0A8J5N9N4_HOMAM|nr:hypothetical protein Hamer_G015387 [Homarus americanus]
MELYPFIILIILGVLFFVSWLSHRFCTAHPHDSSLTADDETAAPEEEQQQLVRVAYMGTVRISNMIYIGDPEPLSDYHSLLEEDKPPTYTEVVSGGPPPPYTPVTCTTSTDPTTASTTATTSPAVLTPTTLPDLPPSYTD